MSIDVSRLGPAAQAQIAQKLLKQRKYHNVPVTVDGIRFDSRKEALRFAALRVLLRAGAISDLRLQPEYTLQEAYTTPEGVRVRAIRYRADFSYWRDGEQIVEDVKSAGTKTRVYEIKRKLLLDKHGITITEV